MQDRHVYLAFPHEEKQIEKQNKLDNFLSDHSGDLAKNQTAGAISNKKTIKCKPKN